MSGWLGRQGNRKLSCACRYSSLIYVGIAFKLHPKDTHGYIRVNRHPIDRRYHLYICHPIDRRRSVNGQTIVQVDQLEMEELWNESRNVK